MNIQEAVLHKITKQAGVQGNGTAQVQVSPDLLVVDPLLADLCKDLCGLFNRSQVGYGTMGVTTPFPERLNEYEAMQLDLLTLSEQATRLLAHQMEREIFSTGGYALFVRYQQDQTDFFLVAMLKLKTSAGISDDLKLLSTLNIDLSKLNEAARINLTRKSTNTQPYLSFVKGGARSGAVTEYFREALACTDYTDSKHFTQQAIVSVKAFIDTRADLGADQKKLLNIEVRKRLVDCFDAAGAGEVTPLALAVAVAVAPLEPQDFLDFAAAAAQAGQHDLSTPFKPHRATYRQLRRITGTIGTVKVSFDVGDVEQGRVAYDDNSDSVLIKNPGAELKSKILDARPSN